MKKNTHYTVQASLIGALYCALTYAQAFIAPATTSGPIQFRFCRFWFGIRCGAIPHFRGALYSWSVYSRRNTGADSRMHNLKYRKYLRAAP